jgi:outer membrane cobalamin receptor
MKMKFKFLVTGSLAYLIILLILNGWAEAQEKTKQKLLTDSSGISKVISDTSKALRDTSSINKTLGKGDSLKKDSVKKYIPIKNLDRLTGSLVIEDTASRKDIMLSDYFTINEILSGEKGFYIADFGIAGQVNPILYQGLNERYVNISVDGVLLENSIYGKPDHLLIPTEEIEKIEILPSSESFLYGSGSALKSINIITAKHYDSRPYTSLRHIEAPYKTYLTDAIFTQNISKNTNIFVGFNYQVAGGDESGYKSINYVTTSKSSIETRYINSNYTNINGRVRLRFNLSDQMNLLVSDYYYKQNRCLNGGVDYEKISANGTDLYEERYNYKNVVNKYAEEEYGKNDLIITFGGRFFKDSTEITKMNIEYTSERRDYSDVSDTLAPKSGIDLKGIKFDISQVVNLPGNILFLNAGLNYQSLNLDSVFICDCRPMETAISYKDNSRLQLFVAGKYTIKISNSTFLNVFGRYDYFIDKIPSTLKYNTHKPAFGANGEKLLTKNISAYAEFSINGIQNSIIENIYRNFFYQFDKESNLFYSIGSKYSVENLYVDASIFSRKLSNPLNYVYNIGTEISRPFYISSDEQKVSGFSIKANANIGKVFGSIKADYNENKYGGKSFVLYPKIYSEAAVYYSDTIFTKDIRIKFGLNAKYFSEFKGQTYYPKYNSLGDYNIYNIPENAIVNFLGILKIQTATLYFTIENLFDTKYMLTPYYPMNDRSFKFAVSWSFLN